MAEQAAFQKTNTNTRIKLRRRGPRRPKTTLSFQLPPLPSDVIGDHEPQSQSHTQFQIVTSLSNQIHLLTLLLRRNKNQHRSQLFFKHLRLLRQSLSRLLQVRADLLALTTSTSISTPIHTIISANRTKASSITSKSIAETVRRRFEAEATLRTQRDAWEDHVREIVVPQCYVAFGAVVADVQFANLGVVLMRVLADVTGVVGGPRPSNDVVVRQGVEDENRTRNERGGNKADLSVRGRGKERERERQPGVGVVEGTSTKATGEDWGEVIERVYEATDSDGEIGRYDDKAGVEIAMGGLATTSDAGTDADADTSARQNETAVPEKRVTERSHADADAGTDKDLTMKNHLGKATSSAEREYKNEGSDRPRKKRKKKDKSAIDDLFKGLF